jgi:mycobactin lysine-N-oxygenase
VKSRSVTTKKLYIIGAGPKAVAIAAKAAVLQSLGYTVPDVTIVEKHEIGAHWVGRFGYTDGRLLLATAPYKDMGFPYDSRLVLDRSHRRKIDEKMLQRFSAQFLALCSKSKWSKHFTNSPFLASLNL